MDFFKERMKDLHEELKGTKTIDGELTIQGFDEEAYEELYQYLLEELSPVMRGDFYRWYEKVTHRYIKWRKRVSSNYDPYIPQEKRPLEYHSIREQLAVFRYYIYRRAKSGY